MGASRARKEGSQQWWLGLSGMRKIGSRPESDAKSETNCRRVENSASDRIEKGNRQVWVIREDVHRFAPGH
jgi:hypothetical protein